MMVMNDRLLFLVLLEILHKQEVWLSVEMVLDQGSLCI